MYNINTYTHIYVARTEYTGWLHTCSVVPVGVISGAFFCPLPECQDSRNAPPSPVLSSNTELWADKSSSLSTVFHSQPLKRSSSEQIYKHINIRNTHALIISFLLASEKKIVPLPTGLHGCGDLDMQCPPETQVLRAWIPWGAKILRSGGNLKR